MGSGGQTLIQTVDSSNNNHFYLSGTDVWGGLGFGLPKGFTTTTFVEIFNGESGRGDNIANSLNTIYIPHHESCFLWFKNGEMYWTGWTVNYPSGKWDIPKVVDFRCSHGVIILKCDNNGTIEYYGGVTRNAYLLGAEFFHTAQSAVKKIDMPVLPDGVEIVDFDIYNARAGYFLTNTGDVYGMGLKDVFGDKNDYIGYTSDGMKKLTSISGVDSFFSNKFDSPRQLHGVVFLCKDNKFYLTNDTSLMYGDNVLQNTWTLVAKNVLEFDASNTAYITRDLNVYIAGKDSRELGLGTVSETPVSVDNYVLITQDEISGKAVSVCQVDSATYILTKDGDLFGAGISTERSELHGLHGWEEIDDNGKYIYENKTTYVKIRENVAQIMFAEDYGSKAYLSTDGRLYFIGTQSSYIGYNTLDTATQFSEVTFPSVLNDADNIKKWLILTCYKSFVLGNDGNIYLAGRSSSDFSGGMTKNGSGFEQFTYGISLSAGESFVDIASVGKADCMMLTNKGRLFGFGGAKYLGIGESSSTLTSNQLIQSANINGKKLTQIVAGKGWYLAVDEDGNVYGTGGNTYGVLGRWKGSDRNQPNSRYRSAFEWVECPDLEI